MRTDNQAILIRPAATFSFSRRRTIGEALSWGEKTLFHAGNCNARMEALWLLASATRDPAPARIFLKRDKSLPGSQNSRYRKHILGRSSGFPLAYLLKSQEFMGLDFFVDPNVLVPRQETGILVREALNRIETGKETRIADIGTGSGVIAVSLAKASRKARITATDLSAKALSVARKNARAHGVLEKIQFMQGGLFRPIEGRPPFDVIVSNPPYVKTSEIWKLQKEIQFEPRLALDGGEDGMKTAAELIRDSIRFLKRGGVFLMEMGYDQSKRATKLMAESGYLDCRTFKDESGIDRVAMGRKTAR